ncbi:toxin-antitoxin system YwqK family antitoxin [Patiriisocius marinus]|nr:toxin-antitoxin system YwqK family antitoxin [Patiriisocius marinus]
MNITSYFQEIIKVRQTLYNSLFVVSCCMLISCNNIATTKEEGSSTSEILNTETLAEISISQLTLHPNEGLLYQNEKPFTGIAVSKYPNGIPSEKVTYLNGIKNGLQTKWFADGIKSFETTYTNGKRNGTSTTWWKNGKLRSQGSYTNGIAQGTHEQWYISGAPFKKLSLVNGKEEGLQQSWRENGKIYNNYEAKNGRIFGLKRANLCFQLEDGVITTTAR